MEINYNFHSLYWIVYCRKSYTDCPRRPLNRVSASVKIFPIRISLIYVLHDISMHLKGCLQSLFFPFTKFLKILCSIKRFLFFCFEVKLIDDFIIFLWVYKEFILSSRPLKLRQNPNLILSSIVSQIWWNNQALII